MRFSKTLVLLFATITLSLIFNNQSLAKDCTKVVPNGPNGWCTPQCTDYVKCKLKIDHSGHAYTWWDNPPSGYHKKANGDTKSEPKEDDILVWDKNVGDGHGHVAIIDKVNTKKKTLTLSETNWGKKYPYCGYDNTRTLTYIDSKDSKNGKCEIKGTNHLLGWLTKK